MPSGSSSTSARVRPPTSPGLWSVRKSEYSVPAPAQVDLHRRDLLRLAEVEQETDTAS